MSAESTLVAILDAAVTSAGTRTYPVLLPETVTLPAISYQTVLPSAPRGYHRGGGHPDYERLRFQLNCWGQTFEQARLLAEEVKAAVSGYNGPAAGEAVGYSFLEAQADEFETETELFARRLDLIAWYRRA